ncbi:MAG: shikimate kinase [Methermicoccaceae archaeon]
MHGQGTAYGAGTVINAIATWKGSAFGIGLTTTVDVSLEEANRTHIEAKSNEGTDCTLMIRCVQLVLARFGLSCEGTVSSKSNIPIARGLKSSSAVANAAVVATLRALGRELPSEEVVRLGVRAALDAGVSITGAYDDACASFFGGVVLTDNRRMILFKRDVLDAEVMIYVPSASQLTSGVNVGRCRLIAPFVEEAYKLAVSGAYDRAMTLNGFLYCAALGYDTDVVMDALRCGASGCGLSGTGSAYTALFREDRDGMDVLEGLWRARGATVIRTRVTNLGVEV